MQVLEWGDLPGNPLQKESAVTVGVFDGIHRGHLLLLEKTRATGLFSVAVTFKEHPRRSLKPQRPHTDIISLNEKIRVFGELGTDALILIDFSPEFSRMSGEDFLMTLEKSANMRALVIGRDFKCGSGGSFRAGQISAFCKQRNIACEIVEPLLEGGLPVSSSRIRAALAAGDLAKAETLLGHPLNPL